MDILPISSIHPDDSLFLEPNLINLASLKRKNIPVADGVIVVPPEFIFKSLLEHFQIKGRDIFEQRLEIIKEQFFSIPAPDSLNSLLSEKKEDYRLIWKNLLAKWLEQIRSNIWREGVNPQLLKSLSAQVIIFTGIVKASGLVYLDTDTNKIVINTSFGKLSSEDSDTIKELCIKSDKLLLIPHIYYWIKELNKDVNIKIYKVQPYTPHEEVNTLSSVYNSLTPNINIVDLPNSLNLDSKLQTKVFINLLNIKNTQADGFLLKSDDFREPDEKVTILLNTLINSGNSKFIYQLSDYDPSTPGIDGCFRLIHQDAAVKKDIQVLKFIELKKQTYNLQIAIPHLRSEEELKEIKKILDKENVNTEKLWMEVSIPENVLNIQSYLEQKIHGVILNLDRLALWIGGLNDKGEETIFYGRQVQALSKMVEELLLILNREKIPVLASGNLVIHDEILELLIKRSVYGLIVNYPNSLGLKQHLYNLEKRLQK